MDTKPTTDCASCGTQLVQDSDSLAAGLCPCCLLADSLHSTIAGQPASSPPPPLEEVSSAFPDFEVIELIGQGAMGAVYKARQKSLDRMVALKLLPKSLAADPEFAKRFEIEAKALAILNHPNIVTVHDFGKQADFYFLLMEFVDGPNLRELINDHQLSHAEALTIIPPLCEALEFAHGHNIVHCDIKPENLLLDKKGRVKVADFGIAKILDQTVTVIDSEKVAGTPAYMAPEQKNDPLAVDARADIYSLGVVFYEMLTGERPNSNLTPPSRKNSSLDVSLDEVVLRALDANPNLRWQSANALNTELQTILTKKLGEPKVAPPENLPRSNPKRAWISCILAVTALLLFVGAYFAHNHVVPVSDSEHQATIEQWFDVLVQRADLREQFDALAAKPQRTPAEQIAKDELWEQMTEHRTLLTIFGKLDGVEESPLDLEAFSKICLALTVLGILVSFFGFRHLSWLRGQEEPLPALLPAIIGTLLLPLLVGLASIVFGVSKFNDLWINALGLSCGIILSLWVVRRVLAWIRNYRNPPSFSIRLTIATALIGLAIAIPFTSLKDGYRSATRQLASDSSDANRSHQEYITMMHHNQRLSQSEKLAETKRGCEDYAQKSQRFYLHRAKPLKMQIPEGNGFIISLVFSILSLAVGMVLIFKFRPHKS
ncbi:MAG: serine/threonine protein kinase [Rubritalea sp.]|jgi:serine/threonine protein kinase